MTMPEKYWLFEGARVSCLKRNNALESFNANIKNDFHFCEKSTMSMFQKKKNDEHAA